MLIKEINWWHVLIIFRPCWGNDIVGMRPYYECTESRKNVQIHPKYRTALQSQTGFILVGGDNDLFIKLVLKVL